MSFELDPRLAANTATVGDLPLSRLLFMNDSRFPWLILVPRREGVIELVDLDSKARGTLIEEIALVSEMLLALPSVAKVNVGALGNIVNQLHVHVAGRSPGDAAWPGPIWGSGDAIPYRLEARDALLSGFRRSLRL